MPELHRLLAAILLAGALSAQQFAPSQPPGLILGPSDFFGMGARGDFDGDGDDDVALVSFSTLRVLQNDGAGVWTGVPTPLPTFFGAVTSLVFADVNGDGRDELLVSGYGANRLFAYQPAGTWADLSAGLPAGLLPTRFLAGDFDGDGDVDFAGAGFSLAGSANVMLQNQGAGSFVASTPFPGYDQSIAAGDVDGDGDLDLLLGGRLWRNDGGLVFTDVTATQLPGTPGTGVSAFGDLDGDGDLDLVAGYVAANDLVVFHNAGNGFFSAVPGSASALSGANRSLALVDVDGDGDLDLVRTCLGGAPLLSRNVGANFVDDPGALPATTAVSSQLLSGDFDHDGDVDLIWLPAQSSGVLLTNRHRQIAAPLAPQIGQTWNVELWSEPGYGTATRAAAFGLALVRYPQPVTLGAWGRLWLDLSWPYLLEPAALLPGSGPTVLSFAVPNAPGLQGIGLHVQALFDGVPAQPELRLTGVVTSVVE